MVVNVNKKSHIGIDNNKYCVQCHRMLPKDTDSNYCNSCQELNLFKEVRDFIRANNVREREVAEHFNLPLEKVRQWINDGKIQYS